MRWVLRPLCWLARWHDWEWRHPVKPRDFEVQCRICGSAEWFGYGSTH